MSEQTNLITFTQNTGDSEIETLREQGRLHGHAHVCYNSLESIRTASMRKDYIGVKHLEQQLPYLRVSTEIVPTDKTGCGNTSEGGLVYKFEWVSELSTDDYVATTDGLSLVIGSSNLDYFRGASFDYAVTSDGVDFVVSNPNGLDACVCSTPIFKLNS